MTILECKVVSDHAVFGISDDSEWTINYRVRCSGRGNTSIAVLQEAFSASPDAVPRQYTYMGNGMYCLSVTCDPVKEGNSTDYTITVRSGALPKGEEQNGDSVDGTGLKNPLKDKCVWWVESISETELVLKDVDGKPITNTVGFPFDVPLTRERRIPVYCVKKNLGSLDEVMAVEATYQNTVNNQAFRGRPAYTVRFLECTAGEPQIVGNVKYYEAVMKFVFKKEGWVSEVLNRGYQCFVVDGATYRITPCTDSEGSPVSEPALLDATGFQIPPNDPGVFIPFNIYPGIDYTTLVADPT